MYSNGDARSAIAQHARDSSSLPPDHASSALWERQTFSRDNFERPERDKYASAKKDWALDNRPSSTRSSNTLFSNAGYTGPPAKRRALGMFFDPPFSLFLHRCHSFLAGKAFSMFSFAPLQLSGSAQRK